MRLAILITSWLQWTATVAAHFNLLLAGERSLNIYIYVAAHVSPDTGLYETERVYSWKFPLNSVLAILYG